MFRGGTHGRHTFRIPALAIVGRQLVAFAEGRTNAGADSGEIAVVGCLSSDDGGTWTEPRTLTETAGYTSGNPAPIVVGDDRIVLLTCRNSAEVDEFAMKGPDLTPDETRRVYRQWISLPDLDATAPDDLTDQVKPAHWGWYATGPGHGLRLQQGPHRGRLLVACNHTDTSTVRSDTPSIERRRTFAVHGLISDDDGHSWRVGYQDPGTEQFSTPNESTAAELADGTVVISVRSGGAGDAATRGQAVSTDGAESLVATMVPQPELIMVPISCSLITVEIEGQEVLILSGLSDPDGRRGLALRFSTDAGARWSAPVVIDPGPSAYSDLGVDDEGRLHVLWESGLERPAETIVHTVIGTDRLAELFHQVGHERVGG